MKSLGNNYLKYELSKVKPNLSKVLAISFGLILFSILSSTLVYAETSSVKIGENNFDVQYVGNGVSVNGIEADLDFVSLIFSVEVTNAQGILQVTFERDFFDSVYMGSDDEFIVLADGDEPSYSEIETTTTSRTLSITLPSGTEEVEIIGSVFGNPLADPEPETPEPETPEPETPEPETPEPETPEPETPEPETPKPETPKPETPKPETPKPETPKPETPKPKIECGSGTVLKDNICVLDEKCGKGTVLQDGICVVKTESSPPQTLGKQLVYGFIAAFVIAGAVGIILALMSKASKSS